MSNFIAFCQHVRYVSDIMVKKLNMDSASYHYQFITNALSSSGKLDDLLQIVAGMLDEEVVVLEDEIKEFVKTLLGKESMEEDLDKLIQEKGRIKGEAKAKEAEAAERAKETARAAVASLTSWKLFGSKDNEEQPETTAQPKATNEKSDEATSSSENCEYSGTEEAEIVENMSETNTQDAQQLRNNLVPTRRGLSL